MALWKTLPNLLFVLIVAASLSLAADVPDDEAPLPADEQAAPEQGTAPESPSSRTFNVDITTETPETPVQGPPILIRRPPAAKSDDVDVNFLLLFRYRFELVTTASGTQYKVRKIALLDIPFSDKTNLNSGLAGTRNGEGPLEWPSDPLNRIFPIDQPLVSVFSLKTVRRLPASADSPSASRLKLLDTFLLGLFQLDLWSGGQYDLACGSAPLDLKLFRLARTKIESGAYVADSDLFSVFRRISSEPRSETVVLDTFLAGVFQQERKGEHRKWNALSLPLFAGADRTVDADSSQFTLLGTRSQNTEFPDWTGHPLFAVWHNAREKNGDTAYELLRLPLLGPLFSRWQADGQTHWYMFPRIVTWGKYPN